MLGFSHVLKPIKWQDLLEEGKNGRNAFSTGAKIHFSEKHILGLGALKITGNLNILRKKCTAALSQSRHARLNFYEYLYNSLLYDKYNNGKLTC